MIGKKQKISFLWNSNMIEGIDYPIESYSKKQCILEVCGHKDALEYVIKNYNKELTEKHILNIHKLLTNLLLSEEESGKYRKCNVYIGGSMGELPIAIKPKMSILIAMAKKAKSKEECWEVHHEFEVIHPFVDGNGRVGRLILNWLLLKNGQKNLEITEFKNRTLYYNSIRDYRFYKLLAWNLIEKNRSTQ